jgi:cytochrome P450
VTTLEHAPEVPLYYDPYDYAIDVDPHPVWRRLREEAPVYWNERYEFFALSRFDDVWRAYLDTTTFSSTHGVELDTLDAPIEFPSMIFMDPPQHDAMRKLVSRAFTPRRIADLEGFVRDLVAELLDRHRGEESFDYVTEFAALLPPMVIGALLDVPAGDRDMLRVWFDAMLHRDEGETGPGPAAIEGATSVAVYAGEMITARRRSPGDDFVSDLLRAEVQDADGAPRRLADHEVQSFITLLAGAGVETVARLLSWAVVVLARHPEQRAKLVVDPALVPAGIEELLRFEAPSPVNGRFSLAPSEFQGVTIPAGSKVLMLNGSANRDPREFDRADTFDVEREITRHISFGYGTHFCLGAALARLEARIALEGTLVRFPTWDIDEPELEMVRTSTVRGFSSVPIHLR